MGFKAGSFHYTFFWGFGLVIIITVGLLPVFSFCFPVELVGFAAHVHEASRGHCCCSQPQATITSWLRVASSDRAVRFQD